MSFGQTISQLAGPILNAGASAYNTWQSSKNLDKSLSAQAAENEKTRQYNYELAKRQNEWNIAQWNRENAALKQATREERAYNSPSAQKARLEAAGINADMLYGQGGVTNTSSPTPVASSPHLTSGAAASPMDWSSLASRKTIGSVITDALSTEMMRAQIDAVKADTKKTLADAGLSEISLEYADFEKRIGLKISEQQYENIKKDYELALQAIDRNKAELEGITLDNAYKAIRNAFESEVFQKQINILSEELKIKRVEAQHFFEYYTAQILGLQADNAWKDAAWIVEQKNGTATAIKYGSEAVTKLVDKLLDFIPTGKGKGKKIRKP